VGEREGGSGIWEGSDFDMDFGNDEVEGVDKEDDEEEGSRSLTLDMTGFEIQAMRHCVIVDPGTYYYTYYLLSRKKTRENES
jgi:hypothetical protein